MLASPIGAASSTSTRLAGKVLASARTRGGSPKANSTSSWTRAATSPCSSPRGISCPTCTPNSLFQGMTSPPWNPPTPTPSLLTTSHSESHWTTSDDPHSFPHVAGHHCHESPMAPEPPWSCLMGRVYRCTSVKSSWPSIGRRHAHIRLVFGPTPRPMCQPLDRAPHETVQGRAGADLQPATHSRVVRRTIVHTRQDTGT